MTPAIHIGDTVRILRHDLTAYVGRVGSVHSLGRSAQDLPTAFVRWGSGGLFVHLEDLELIEEYTGVRQARLAGLPFIRGER